jgi:hypothetical protein
VDNSGRLTTETKLYKHGENISDDENDGTIINHLNESSFMESTPNSYA